MGVRHLTTLIKEFVPDGYKDVNMLDIQKECENYQKSHNSKPLIVIDLLGLLRLIPKFDSKTLIKDENQAKFESLLGGRFKKYQKTTENLFQFLSSCGDLVFFVDGSVRPDKLDHWMKRNNQNYHEMIEVMDMINKGLPLAYIVDNLRDFPRFTTHLKIVKKFARKYGTVITTRTKECDSEIAKYAIENNAAIVLAEDSDFLIFEGEWRLFSINDLSINPPATKEYNKKALWKYLGLKNFYQMAMLATISGNDLVPFDDVKWFHHRLIDPENLNRGWKPLDEKFLAIAKFIKDELVGKKSREVVQIITECAFHWESRNKMKPLVRKSIDMYHTNFEITDPTDELESYWIANNNNFAYNILSGKVTKFSILYYDLRDDHPSLLDAQLKMYRKQIGIILKHQNRDINFETVVKESHDEEYKKITIKPDYPDFELPSLIHLFDSQNYPQHDELRWIILKWIYGGEKEIEELPQKFIGDVLTLMYLRHEDLITIFEADLILMTIKMVQEENYDEIIPEVLDPRAFRTSFLFTKFRETTMRNLKIVGLKDLRKLIDFDGLIFHNLYLKHSHLRESDLSHLLGEELMPYRLYA